MTRNAMTHRTDKAREYAGEAAIVLFVIGLICCSIGFLVGLAGA
jgi:hypothetical protein